MYVARLVGAHPPVLVEPVLVGLELAQVHGVPNKCWFHQAINIGLHRHGRTRVYLEEPRLHVLVQHDIETEQLEATLEIGHERAQVDARKNNDLFDLCPQELIVVAKVHEIRFQLSE